MLEANVQLVIKHLERLQTSPVLDAYRQALHGIHGAVTALLDWAEPAWVEDEAWLKSACEVRTLEIMTERGRVEVQQARTLGENSIAASEVVVDPDVSLGDFQYLITVRPEELLASSVQKCWELRDGEIDRSKGWCIDQTRAFFLEPTQVEQATKVILHFMGVVQALHGALGESSVGTKAEPE